MFLKSAHLYDLFYHGKNYADEAQKLQALIGTHKQSDGNALLDIACGTGHHLQFLKRLYQAEGLDLNEELLELARERNPDIPLHHGNMIDFELKKQFDAILCLFSSIGYTRTRDNLEACVANMSRHLKPGGVLIVEPWFDNQSYYPGMAHMALVDEPPVKACRMNVSRIENGLSIIEFHYLVAVEGQDVSHFTERHELGLFSEEDHIQAFRNSGLQVSYDHDGLIGRGLCIGVKPTSR